MSINVAETGSSFEERDQEMHKYNYLQFKIMEAMGFGTKRSEMDWGNQGYSDRYRKIIEDKKVEYPEFMSEIPTDIADKAWGTEQMQNIIKDIVRELDAPLVQ